MVDTEGKQRDPGNAAQAEQHPDYDLHIKHTAPNQVTAIVWLMGRRYEGTLTCRLGR